MGIGNKLTNLINGQNRNVNDLANAINIPASTIYSIIRRNNTKVDLDILQKIADELCVTLDYFSDGSSQPLNTLNSSELSHIQKYRTLDKHGKELVSMVLSKEHQRCTTVAELTANEVKVMIRLPYPYMPVSAGMGQYLADGGDDVLEMESTPLTRQADFVLKVSGDSMRPDYSNGDIVLVKSQSDIEIGEIGVFVINNEGFIKKKGIESLISVNPDFNNITVSEHDDCRCVGKVLGKV